VSDLFVTAYMTSKNRNAKGSVDLEDDMWVMEELMASFHNTTLQFGDLLGGLVKKLEDQYNFTKMKVCGKYHERAQNNGDVMRLLLILAYQVCCNVEDTSGNTNVELLPFWEHTKKEEAWHGAIQLFAALLFGIDKEAAQYSGTAKVIQNEKYFLNQYLVKSKKGCIKKEVLRGLQVMSIQVFSSMALWSLKSQVVKAEPEVKKVSEKSQGVSILRGFCVGLWSRGDDKVAVEACGVNVQKLGYSTHLREIMSLCNKSGLTATKNWVKKEEEDMMPEVCPESVNEDGTADNNRFVVAIMNEVRRLNEELSTKNEDLSKRLDKLEKKRKRSEN
jgi:hypothetical protein